MTVRIVEVGPRDGLQNEAVPVPTAVKLRFIGALGAAGLQEIEATSFVSPKWVPQLADADVLWPQLTPGPKYSALVPNLKGLERAIVAGVDRIALFTAASESFTQKNINMSIDQSLEAFQDVVAAFRESRSSAWVRGYVSTAFECPYEGRIAPAAVVRVVERLRDIGVDEISLGDTIGSASPQEVKTLGGVVKNAFEMSAIAFHFHDTRGTAIANVYAALEGGFEIFDASAAGLGGCPYAPGAGGNLATEDLVYLLQREDLETSIDLEALARSSLEVLETLGRPVEAKAQLAVLSRSNAATCAM
jgi:hydroxymethylglutaryl-CoA lyase